MTTAKTLRPAQLVARWGGGVTLGTLANWRSQGTGPTFIKLGGRVAYPVDALVEWEQANTKFGVNRK